MIYPRMLLAGRCHLEPQSSCDVRSPSAPTLKLREAVMRRQRVFLPCCLATRALGKPCSALSVKSGMCQKKHPRLVLRNFFPLPLYPQDTSQFLQGLASLVAQRRKHLPTMQETQVWALGWEDSLEKGMATHSSILAWRIPWTEEPGGLQSMGSQRVGHDWATSHTHYMQVRKQQLELHMEQQTGSK